MISASRLFGASPNLSLTPSVVGIVPKIVCDEMWLTRRSTDSTVPSLTEVEESQDVHQEL